MKHWLSLLLFAILLVGCAAPPTATPTLTPSATPTMTPSPTLTLTPTATLEPTVTLTPTPTMPPIDYEAASWGELYERKLCTPETAITPDDFFENILPNLPLDKDLSWVYENRSGSDLLGCWIVYTWPRARGVETMYGYGKGFYIIKSRIYPMKFDYYWYKWANPNPTNWVWPTPTPEN